MRNLKLTLEYDGTGLSGWQRQENGPTVQAHLEEALETMVGVPTRVTGASRTDAGVHALGQVASFHTESEIPTHGIRRGLNSKLPPGIAVVEVREVPAEFDARRSSRGKHYRYWVLARADRSPVRRLYSWHQPRPLALDAMRQAAQAMVGEHDFSAFRAAGCTALTPTRHVSSVEISVPEPGLVQFDVRGNAFLRNMVRIMVGTLIDVGVGRFTAAQLPEIISSCDRNRAGQTAPARGLTLVEVFY